MVNCLFEMAILSQVQGDMQQVVCFELCHQVARHGSVVVVVMT
jgi:hypothetical protein